MSGETNGNGRLDRIEQTLEKLAEAQLKHEFAATKRDLKQEKELADYRRQSEERFARIETVLAHLTQLVGIFGDKTYEFDEKVKLVKDAL